MALVRKSKSLLISIKTFIYKWSNSPGTGDDTQGIFSATSIFSYGRITDHIFPLSSENSVSLRFYMYSLTNCDSPSNRDFTHDYPFQHAVRLYKPRIGILFFPAKQNLIPKVLFIHFNLIFSTSTQWVVALKLFISIYWRLSWLS